MTQPIANRLVLPCGFNLLNRFGKSAMTECLAHPASCDPNEKHIELYKRWTAGNPGILISGNIMIDRNYREAPRNICLDEKSSIEAFKKLTNTTKSSSLDDKVAFIAQLSHPGRQATIASTFKSVGPSSIKLELPVSFF